MSLCSHTWSLLCWRTVTYYGAQPGHDPPKWWGDLWSSRCYVRLCWHILCPGRFIIRGITATVQPTGDPVPQIGLRLKDRFVLPASRSATKEIVQFYSSIEGAGSWSTFIKNSQGENTVANKPDLPNLRLVCVIDR
mgnify:CR=1 FL=1